jgi:hypothetical protein
LIKIFVDLFDKNIYISDEKDYWERKHSICTEKKCVVVAVFGRRLLIVLTIG